MSNFRTTSPASVGGHRSRRRAGRRTGALVLAGFVALAACTGPEPAQPSPSSSAPGETPAPFTEQFRPQFHYSPPTGNLADPNGLVWYEGEYHLFHQQDGTWAHAVSPDLVHWTTLPTALEHDELGLAMSGSVVVDGANTSGLFDDDEGGLVAIYTNTTGGEAQSIAYSADRGRTWKRYDSNPVLPNEGRKDFRDPKVFWHEATRSWVMVVATGSTVSLFASPDLIDWRFLSEFGAGQGLHSAVWECPDLYALPVDGDAERTRWVLSVSVGDGEETAGSTAQYFVGDFDGTTFTRDGPAEAVQITDVGQDFYAAQTFENGPGGRRVWLGWMGNWRYPYSAPTDGFKGAMSVPRTLALRTVDGETRLTQEPVAELESLRADTVERADLHVDGDLPLDITGTTYEFTAEVAVGSAREFGLRVREGDAPGSPAATVVGVDVAGGQFFLDRTRGGLATIDTRSGEPFDFGLRRSAEFRPAGKVVTLHGFVDESSVEVFVDDGVQTATMLIYPDPADNGMSLYSVGGDVTVRSLVVHDLASFRP